MKSYNKLLKYGCFVIGFFLFGFWIIYSSLAIEMPSEKNPVILYSNSSHQSLKLVVLKALRTAHSNLLIHSFALSDASILRVLSLASGKTIQILTDKSTTYKGQELKEYGVNWQKIRISGLMHEKILVVDDTLSFLGTANMTYESLTMHENLMVGIYSQSLADELKSHHQTLKTQYIERPKKALRQFTSFELPGHGLTLYFLPLTSDAPLESILEHIYKAIESIDVAMFTLTHEKLIHALIEAKTRGVKVRVFLDAQSIKGASSKAFQILKKANIPVFANRGQQLLHHKIMLVDEKVLVLGSANWTKAAFKKNQDFFIILSKLSPQHVTFCSKLFKKLRQNSIPAKA